MASFAEWTEEQKKKKKKQSAEGVSFTEYTKSVLGRDDIESPLSEREDDIAPVRTTTEEDDRKWFQKGAYGEIDWDNKSVWENIGLMYKGARATETDLLENLGAGILGLGEKTVDTLAYLAPLAAQGQFYQNGGAYLPYDIQQANQAAFDQSKEGMSKFIAKDLYDEEKVAKTIISEPVKSVTGIDAETDSILGEKSDALAQSAGQLAGTVALQAAGVPWFVTTGVATFGSEAESALDQGATYEEAGLSAAISAGAEILTEKISGGIKFGGKTLDDALTKEIARGVSNKVVRTLTKLGLDMAGEGFEEVLSGTMSALGQKITYADDQELSELFSSEDALESFIGGAVLGGVGGGVQAIKSGSKGVDYTSGLTQNEEAVVKKVYDDMVAEAEKNGKVTQAQKSKIYNEVLEQMEKGYISTDTIEEVLGGETYQTYKDTIDSEDALQNEFDTLNKMKQGEMTGEQIDRRAELKQQLEDLKNNSQRNQLKTQLSDEVFGLAKDSRLAESYNERARRSQVYEADLTQYDAKQQQTIQKAIDSGILNNTNRTHEFVDLIAKISADKGVLFDFTNNQKLKDSGFAVDGKTVNGYVTKDGVTLNIDSSKSLNSVTGHEITHILEGTELYTELQNTLFEYAKSKNDYQSRYDSLTELYKNVEGANIEAELTADLVGDYLFTDADFINNLSTSHRNVFQKIYDEIKYLCKVATAGSKEARELEKVKKAFEDAYRADSEASGDTKYSMAEMPVKQEISSAGTSLNQIPALFKDKNVQFGKTNIDIGGGKFDQAKNFLAEKGTNSLIFDPYNRGAEENTDTLKFLQDGNKADTATCANVLNVIAEPAARSNVILEAAKSIKPDGTAYFMVYEGNGSGVGRQTSAGWQNNRKTADYVGEISEWFETVQRKGKLIIAKDPVANLPQASWEIQPGEAVRYSLSDSDGKQLSKEQQEFFKDSKVRDENGNLKVMYHGSENAGFHTFDNRFSDDDTSFFFVDRNDVAQSYSGTSEVYEARTIRTVEDMNNFLAEIGEEDYKVIEENGKFTLLQENEYVADSDTAQGIYEEYCDWVGVGYGDANYKVYLNLKNPLVVDAGGRNWNRISGEFSQEIYDRYQSLTEAEKESLVQLASWEDASIFRDEVLTAVESVERDASYVDEHTRNIASAAEKLGDADMYRLFDIATDGFSEESLRENAVNYLKTRDYAQRAKEQGYDGVIFNNIVDNGGYADGTEGASTVAIAFDSNQIKSVRNNKPTADPDIRYSISGVNAKTANSSMLLRAEHLLNAGADSETVRQETGWYKGYDGKMRFEIDDSKSELIENPNLEKHEGDGTTYFTGKLSDILKHNELYEAYPQLRNVNIVIQPTETGTRGIYQPNSNYITLSLELFKRHTKEYEAYLNGGRVAEIERIEQTPEYKEYNKWYEDDELAEKLSPEEWLVGEKAAQDKFFSSELGKKYYQLKWGKPPVQTTEFGWGKEAREVLMHEIQHAVQKIEDFARGSSPGYWRRVLEAGDTIQTAEQKAELREAEDKLFAVYKQNPEFYTEMTDLLSTAPDMPRGKVDWDTLEQLEEDPIEWQEFDKTRDALEEKYGTMEVFDFFDLYHDVERFKERSLSADDAYYSTAGEIEARDTANRLNLSAEQRRNKRPDIDKKSVVFADARYSLSAETEAVYMDAVNRGDTKTAQKMVDETAQNAGYTIKAYHGSPARFTVFDKNRVGKGTDQFGAGFYFGTTDEISKAYGGEQYEVYLDIKKPIKVYRTADGGDLYDVEITPAQAYKILRKHPKMYDAEESPLGDWYDTYWETGAKEWMVRDLANNYSTIGLLDGDLFREYPNELHEAIRDVLGYDGVEVSFDNTDSKFYVAWFDNQMKSADPVVRDDEGNVIPLSERFNPDKNDIRYSISDIGQKHKQYGTYNVYGKDILLDKGEVAPVEEVAPVSKAETAAETAKTEQNVPKTENVDDMFPDDLAPVADELDTLYAQREAIEDRLREAVAAEDVDAFNQINAEYEAVYNKIAELEADEADRIGSLDDADIPPEMEAPYPGERESTTVSDPFANRDWYEMKDRKVKAYMYENPEVKPFFQNEAYAMMDELSNTIKAERWYDDKLHYESGGEKGFGGNKRFTSDSIAEMLDYWGMSYADIEKGLDAIIEDNGAENIAAAKKIEFMLNDRLLNGYKDFFTNKQKPPNQEYINLLNEKQINEYSKEAFDSFMATADQYAPPAAEVPTAENTEDIAPVAEKYEAIRPKPSKEPKLIRVNTAEVKTSKGGEVKGQQALYKEAIRNESDQTAEILTEEPLTEKRKSRAWSRFVANFGDKGNVFETLSLKTKNRELQARYNSLHYAEGKAQKLLGEGTTGVKSLNDIREEVEQAGKTQQFYEYLYHLHNVDRMQLEGRYKDTPNKPVFGDTVTADMSRAAATQLAKENPEFRRWSQDVYRFNSHLRKLLVDGGVISQETADLWAEMYPHYVPIRRAGDVGLNINVPLDTRKTGVNAPIKRATGGSRDILPLFDTMAQRTLQTYKAIAKNRFGVELKNTLGTTIAKEQTSVDGVIDSVDQQEGLLQEGKNGKAPTFTVFENGEKVTFEITEDMYDALKPTSGGLAYTNKVANAVSNIRRGLLTEYNPTFMLTNAIKDSQDVLINSQHAAKTYATYPKAIVQLASKGKWYTEYMENGGEQNTYFDKETNTFEKKKSGFVKAIGIPLDAISAANNFIERVPRLAEYIASREAGRSIDVSMLDAARVTTNFAAGGDVTKFLNRNGATFLNASVQGFMQNVRNVREAKANGLKGVGVLAAKVAVAGLSGLLLNHLLWEDDEEYEELSDYVKQNYYIVGKYGDGQFVRIPKGRMLAVIQNAFEQMQNAITGDDEVDLQTFGELFISNLAPNNPLDNNIISPIIQVAQNKTWYGEDLVPTRLQDLPAAEQFDESTDSISKWLGEKLNVSPYKINYLLDQYSGGIGDTFLPMLTPEAERGDDSFEGNLIAPLKDKFTTDSVMNNQNVTDFYNLKDELTVNANASDATDEDILKNKYINAVNSELSELYAQKREVQNSNMSDAEKYDKVRDIQSQIANLTEDALNTYEDVRYEEDGEYAVIGDKYFQWYTPEEGDPYWRKLTESQKTKYLVTSAAGDANYATDGNVHYRRDEDGEWTKISDKQLARQNEVTQALGITPEEYWSETEISFMPMSNGEYEYAYDNPENYAVAKAVGGYDSYKQYSSELYNIKADKDENGKSINGSRKEKVAEYINNLDADYGEKIILFKSEYPSDDTYNYEIIDYLNGREDISYEEMEIILKKLGFTVSSDGTISWD